MAIKIIRHQISASSNFNGAIPTGSPTTVANKDTYDEQAGGGKFVVGGSGVVLQEVKVELDANAEWKLELLDGSDVLIREIGATPLEADDPTDPDSAKSLLHSSVPQCFSCAIPVAAGEKLSLVTTLATGAIAAEITYEDGV